MIKTLPALVHTRHAKKAALFKNADTGLIMNLHKIALSSPVKKGQ